MRLEPSETTQSPEVEQAKTDTSETLQPTTLKPSKTNSGIDILAYLIPTIVIIIIIATIIFRRCKQKKQTEIKN